MTHIVGLVYKSSLNSICIIMVLAVIAWAGIGAVSKEKCKKEYSWKYINSFFLLCSILIVLYTTILNRNSTSRELILVPFYAFYEAIEKPEMYRSMLMNVFLFEPIGLTLPFALSDRIKKNVSITIGFAFLLSIIIEVMQYVLCLGRAEIDDVICNTLGCAIGTCAYLLYKEGRNSDS